MLLISLLWWYRNKSKNIKHASDEPLLWEIKYGKNASEEKIVKTRILVLGRLDLVTIWLATNNERNISDALINSNLSENCLKKSIIIFG